MLHAQPAEARAAQKPRERGREDGTEGVCWDRRCTRRGPGSRAAGPGQPAAFAAIRLHSSGTQSQGLRRAPPERWKRLMPDAGWRVRRRAGRAASGRARSRPREREHAGPRQAPLLPSRCRGRHDFIREP